jgi:ABC-2 type transport system permease protein
MAQAVRGGFPRELLLNLTLRQIRGTYKKSTLGFGWSMLNPLVTIGVYALVFRVLLKFNPPVGDPSGLHNYGLFLVAGILPWQFMVMALVGQTGSLTGNWSLIEKVYFPRWTIPLSTLLAGLFEFLLEMAVLVALLAVVWQAWAVLYLPVILVVMALQAVFIFGIGQVLAIWNARFRDTEHLVRLATQIWFWLTPIIYPITVVSDSDHTILGVHIETLYRLNPMLWFTEAYRALLYDVRLPSLATFAAISAWAAGALMVGALYFKRHEPRIAERL